MHTNTLIFFDASWAIVSEIDNAEAGKAASRIVMITSIMACVVTIIMVVITAVFLRKLLIVKKIQKITESILKIVGDDEESNNKIDLTHIDELIESKDILFKAKDELYSLINSLCKFVHATNNTICITMENSGVVASATSELSATANELSATFNEQSSQVGSVASAMDEMTVSSQEVLQRVETAKEKANHSTEMANKGKQRLADVNEQIQSIQQATGKLSVTISNLNTSSIDIKDILSVIDDIADQTNLLALNAAIEAARAGEAGRGFAVVADEVRKLAERTQTATQEIGQIIYSLQTETTSATENMSLSEKMVESGVSVIHETNIIFEDITSSIQDVGDSNNFIETAVHEQNKALNEINDSVQQISAGIEESSHAVAEVSKTVCDIEVQADSLRNAIDCFKVA